MAVLKETFKFIKLKTIENRHNCNSYPSPVSNHMGDWSSFFIFINFQRTFHFLRNSLKMGGSSTLQFKDWLLDFISRWERRKNRKYSNLVLQSTFVKTLTHLIKKKRPIWGKWPTRKNMKKYGRKTFFSLIKFGFSLGSL